MVTLWYEGPRCVVARGDQASEALLLALSGDVDAVVLLAPPAVSSLDLALRDVAVPVLGLFGTDDAGSPPEFGHGWKRAMPKFYQMFVYGSLDERSPAVDALIADFFARRDNFLVRVVDDKMHD